MSRGKQTPKRVIMPDPRYQSVLVSKFINCLMISGKKTVAQNIVYSTLEELAVKKAEAAAVLFEKIMDAVRPQVEVRSRRAGGANYQVPTPISTDRQNALAFRWLIIAAKARRGHSMVEKLVAEFNDALEGQGGAVKKKEDIHRMAEANKAFAHFARFNR